MVSCPNSTYSFFCSCLVAGLCASLVRFRFLMPTEKGVEPRFPCCSPCQCVGVDEDGATVVSSGMYSRDLRVRQSERRQDSPPPTLSITAVSSILFSKACRQKALMLPS
uniref:Uncharacterized protein n=1 Tax=Solanum lycopersicum TaxID=4081 RepID=A0A3Q7IUX8_SOLLC